MCSHIVLTALREGSLNEFDALAQRVSAARLDELAASEHGVTWAAVPSGIVPSDYRLRLLHIVARMHRYDGGATHLDIAAFEELVRALDAGDREWAEVAARVWIQLTMHVIEAASLWHQGRSLLDRFPSIIESSPLLLGSIAMLAATSGSTETEQLWNRVLTHPLLGDNAEQRMGLELEWVRGYLLYQSGDLRRGIAVLDRLRHGFASMRTPIAELRMTEATLELATALTWVGRADEAAQAVRITLDHVEPNGELAIWLCGAAAYPAAHLDDQTAINAAIESLARTQTDATTLVMRTLIPARIVHAARANDPSALDDAIADALEIEGARMLDPDLRCAWRVHAAEALHAVGDDAHALELVADLDTVITQLPYGLPSHELRRDTLLIAIRGADDLDEVKRVATIAARLGMDLNSVGLPDHAHSAASPPPLHIRLLGPLTVERNGAPVPDGAWQNRRQARLLLALLLVHGPTVQVDDVVTTLWGELSPRSISSRISPLCNTIRTVIGTSESIDPPRMLIMKRGSIRLDLHPDDRCDLHELRAVSELAASDPQRARSEVLDVLPLLTQQPIADVGACAAATTIRLAVEQELLELAPALAMAWSNQPAPDAVIDAVIRAHSAYPLSVETCSQLITLHAARGNLAAASSTFHATRNALRDELGMSVPDDLTRLHASLLATGATRT